MSDLIERLRSAGADGDAIYCMNRCVEAADELERQAKEIAELKLISENIGELHSVTLDKYAKLKAVAKEMSEALEKIIQHTPGSTIPCNGTKCREPWCFSCNTEEDAEKAIQQVFDDCGLGNQALAHWKELEE